MSPRRTTARPCSYMLRPRAEVVARKTRARCAPTASTVDFAATTSYFTAREPSGGGPQSVARRRLERGVEDAGGRRLCPRPGEAVGATADRRLLGKNHGDAREPTSAVCAAH